MRVMAWILQGQDLIPLRHQCKPGARLFEVIILKNDIDPSLRPANLNEVLISYSAPLYVLLAEYPSVSC